MKKKSTGPSLIFLNFQGEFVSVLLDAKVTTSASDGETIEQAELPMTVQAFLVDEDARFLYLGSHYNLADPNSGVDRAIPKRRILYIEKMKPHDHLAEILDNMEVPTKGEAN